MEKNTQGLCRIQRLICYWSLIIWILLSPSHGLGFEQSETSLVRFNTPGVVTFQKDQEEFTVKVPIPRRWLVENVTLRLAFVNSSALLASRSQLVISCNKVPVAQVPLIPEAPEGEVTVPIPVSLLEPGYNDLTFRVAQNFKDDDCIPSDPPEVWTSLKLFDSFLEISHDLKEVPLSLASVSSFLFDPRMHEENEVHLVLPEYSTQMLELAVLAASGVALRFDYRDVRFSLGKELRHGVDNILLGDSGFVKPFLGSFNLEPGDDHLIVSHLPGLEKNRNNQQPPDRRHALITISGTDQKGLRRSVEAFSTLSFPLPDSARARIKDVLLPEITKYSGRNVLAPGKEYTFRELGWYTSTFRGSNLIQSDLNFIIPSDLSLESNRFIELSLDLVYGAKMREDSVLALYINNDFLASIPLDNDQGGSFRGYRVRLPMSYIKPGKNTLKLQPVLTPLLTGNCNMIQTGQLVVTVFDNSRLIMPEVPHYTEMPRLEYLLDDGFPLTGFPDFRTTDVLLPEINRHSATAMINLVTLIVQQKGVQPFRLQVREKLPAGKEKNLLVVGPLETLPQEIVQSAPFGEVIRMGFQGRLPGSVVDKTWIDRIRDTIYPENVSSSSSQKDVVTLDTQLKIGKERILLSEFESPLSAMQSVVLVTADQSDDLVAGIKSLSDVKVRRQLRDGIALIDFGQLEPVVRTGQLSAPYSSAAYTIPNLLSYLVNKITWKFYMVLLILLLILAALLTGMVKRRRKRRLQQTEGRNKPKAEKADEAVVK